jgi:hypothetical protein
MVSRANKTVLPLLAVLTLLAASCATEKLDDVGWPGSEVFKMPQGFMAETLELKEGRFRYWFSSDVIPRHGPKYPIEGSYLWQGDELVLSTGKTFKVRQINGKRALLWPQAVDTWDRNQLIPGHILLPVESINAITPAIALAGLPEHSGMAERVDFKKWDSQLHSIITNNTASTTELLEAISRLGRVTEPPALWTAVVNDPNFSKDHRRKSIFALFRRHGRYCTGLRELAKVISSPKWFQVSDITEVTYVFGNIPVELNKDETVFRIMVLSSEHEGGPSIYVRLMGHVKKDVFSKLLFGTADPTQDDVVVLQCGFTDNYEIWLQPR